MADDILKLVEDEEAVACRDLHRGVIISPGAIGDCVMMLPLARFMKDSLGLGGVDFIGHSEYIDFFPGRTCIDRITSLDSIEFHRLFVDHGDFDLEDNDRLIGSLGGYEWVVSFLGHGDGNYESNLIFTVHCSRGAEITLLPLEPADGFSGHTSEFHVRSFIEANSPDETDEAGEANEAGYEFDGREVLIRPHPSDVQCGRELLASVGVKAGGRIVLIHPGSGGRSKCWALENFCGLADMLAAEGASVVFVLGPAESERFDAGAMSVMEAAGTCISGLDMCQIVQILGCAEVFVGNDSGISHIAGGLGRAVVTVFGPTDPARYRPVGPGVRVFQADMAGFDGIHPKDVQDAARLVCGILDD